MSSSLTYHTHTLKTFHAPSRLHSNFYCLCIPGNRPSPCIDHYYRWFYGFFIMLWWKWSLLLGQNHTGSQQNHYLWVQKLKNLMVTCSESGFDGLDNGHTTHQDRIGRLRGWTRGTPHSGKHGVWIHLKPMILIDWLTESKSHFIGYIIVIIWPIEMCARWWPNYRLFMSDETKS